ncbi:MAG: bifunctional metallophosphatase/5'-nucleotidase [Oscillospiraceae bacterium]|jgi:5'-nucleotidase/UDP-sugar diphosphatase
MKKKLLSITNFLLIACMCILMLPVTAFAGNSMTGQTVILYTANLRGNINVLPQIAQLKAEYEAEGAEVILVDAGNYLQGTVYSTYDSGKTVVSLMEQTGYDVVTVGSHEFDFGTGTIGVDQHGILFQDDTFGKFFTEASFDGISSNIMITKNGSAVNVYNANAVVTTSSGLKIGFYGICDPNTVNQVLETNLTDLSFSAPVSTAATQKQALAACDLTVCLSNAGTLSTDAADVLIDINANAGLKVGKIVLDSTGKVVASESIDLSGVSSNAAVKAAVDSYKATVDAAYPASSIAKNNVTLNGSMEAVRSQETNLGDLWTDALLWFAKEGGIANYYDPDEIAAGNSGIQMDADHVVAVWNGGNLRDYLNSGDVTAKDLARVLPYPNKVAVVYLSGAQLLEMLESATQGLPYSGTTSDACASFAQVAGIKYSVDTAKKYDAGEAYGKHWFEANSINRVSITEINGKPFDKDAVYAVITSNAIYNGMDSNYICADKDATLSTITSATVRDVVWMYIQQKLGGVIGNEYAQPQGRITITASEPENNGNGNGDGSGNGNGNVATDPDEIPVNKGEESPKSGDSTAPLTLMAFTALSGVILIKVLMKRKSN